MRGVERISNAYFKPKSLERQGRLYERLGIKLFRKLYYATMGKLLRNVVWIKGHSIESIVRFTKGTKVAEIIHLSVALFLLLAAFVRLTQGSYWRAALIMAVNVVTNVYPIMLQRYNRVRVHHLLENRNGTLE